MISLIDEWSLVVSFGNTCPRDIWSVWEQAGEGGLLASRGWSSRVRLSMSPCTGWPWQQRVTQPKTLTVLTLRNPAPADGSCGDKCPGEH